jgi:hypothetical protein
VLQRIGLDPSFATEVQGSRVDDLHVRWGDPVRAWRYQIKAVEDLEWGLNLKLGIAVDLQVAAVAATDVPSAGDEIASVVTFSRKGYNGVSETALPMTSSTTS